MNCFDSSFCVQQIKGDYGEGVVRLASLERGAGRKGQATRTAVSRRPGLRHMQMSAMEKMAGTFDPALDRPAVEFMQDVKGMMGHAHDDMGRVVTFFGQPDGVDDLPLTDEQLTVVIYAAFG